MHLNKRRYFNRDNSRMTPDVAVDSTPASRAFRRANSSPVNLVSAASHALRTLAGLALLALPVVTSAAPPANDSPKNEPKAIVEALIGRDFRGMPRYTGGHEQFEYKPIFESYPPYDIEQLSKAIGSNTTREVTPTFGKCTQEMLVKDIKVTNVQYAQTPYEAYVTVEAEVLALRLFNPDKVPADRRCSWLGLEVQNTKTGKREAYFDNADDGGALLKMMKQFGTFQGDYVVVDPHRRRWSYGVHMFLPKSGKGLRRHYDHAAPLGYRKYVDALEPRWSIQDPVPPQAVHLGAAIKRTAQVLKHAEGMAQGYCLMAIEHVTGKRPKQPDMKHPACGAGSSTATFLDQARRFNSQLEVLRSIK